MIGNFILFDMIIRVHRFTSVSSLALSCIKITCTRTNQHCRFTLCWTCFIYFYHLLHILACYLELTVHINKMLAKRKNSDVLLNIPDESIMIIFTSNYLSRVVTCLPTFLQFLVGAFFAGKQNISKTCKYAQSLKTPELLHVWSTNR